MKKATPKSLGCLFEGDLRIFVALVGEAAREGTDLGCVEMGGCSVSGRGGNGAYELILERLGAQVELSIALVWVFVV